MVTKVIKTTVDEEAYKELVEMRKKEGVPSVSALFLKLSGQLSSDKMVREVVRTALSKAKKTQKGKEYRLCDLFEDATWKKYTPGVRTKAGAAFKAEVDTAVHGIRPTRKSSANHQYYETTV
jgi:predicted CopG family antitoxin